MLPAKDLRVWVRRKILQADDTLATRGTFRP